MRALLLLALLGLAGCGFHLRKEIELPADLAAIRVETPEPWGGLQRQLEQALRRAGAATGAAGGAVLRVVTASMEQKPLSIGVGGRVQEYALEYRVDVELADAEGRIVLPRETLRLEREYRFDTAQAQGSPAEEEVLRADLERAMGEAILRRIEAVLRSR
ncbi:MAG: hypothetical protein KatS3mg126_2162 [Lysobacteraceae bacterium]|nr:MAG: hypothetical protein KatS3mg126_2162 [Xanthomonadaceae bacterium]